MKTQIVLWDKKKYGDYATYNVIKMYNNKSYIVNTEFDDIILSVSQYPLVVVNNIVYEAQSNIIDTDNNVNIVICYPR